MRNYSVDVAADLADQSAAAATKLHTNMNPTKIGSKIMSTNSGDKSIGSLTKKAMKSGLKAPAMSELGIGKLFHVAKSRPIANTSRIMVEMTTSECDLHPTNRPTGFTPSMNVSAKRYVSDLITITREQVEGRDFSPILSRLDLKVLPTERALVAMMGRFSFRFIGYPKNDYPLLRQDVREYFHMLDGVWPYWAYFFTTEFGFDYLTSIVKIETWKNDGGPYRSEQRFDHKILTESLSRALQHLKQIASRTDMSELQVLHRCVQVIDSFGEYYEDATFSDTCMATERLIAFMAWPQVA